MQWIFEDGTTRACQRVWRGLREVRHGYTQMTERRRCLVHSLASDRWRSSTLSSVFMIPDAQLCRCVLTSYVFSRRLSLLSSFVRRSWHSYGFFFFFKQKTAYEIGQ